MYNKYPYTDFHELNLDWFLDEFQIIKEKYDSLDSMTENAVTQLLTEWLEDGTLTTITEEILDGIISRIEQLEEDRNNINSIVNDHNFVWLGDSYGMRNTPNWVSECIENLGGTGFGVSGRGFLPSGNTFLMSLQTVNATLTSDQKNAVTDIVICGGWNDAREIESGYGRADLQNAIFACHDYIRANFPNAVMWIGFMANQTYYASQADEVSMPSFYSTRLVYNGSNRKYIKHISSCQYPLNNVKNFDDTYFHPDADAALYLYSAVAAEVLGGSYDYIDNNALRTSDLEVSTGISGYGGLSAFYNNVIEYKTEFFTITNLTTDVLFKFKLDCMPFPLKGDQLMMQGQFQGTIDGTRYNGILPLVLNADGRVRILWNGSLNNFSSMSGVMKIHHITTNEILWQSL